jgi:WD40 repeat protein
MYTLDVSGSFKVEQPQGTYIYHIEPIGDEIAAISSDDCLRLISPTSLHGPPLKVIPKVHAEVTCLKALDGQSAIACTAGRDGRVNIWDLQGNTKVAELKTSMLRYFAVFHSCYLVSGSAARILLLQMETRLPPNHSSTGCPPRFCGGCHVEHWIMCSANHPLAKTC